MTAETELLRPRRPVEQRRRLAEQLVAIVGPESVLWEDYDLMIYEYDGSIDKAVPDAVVLPSSAEQVAAIVRLCNRERIPYTARGAGTGLSGGCIPLEGGVLIGFSKLNRVLELDLENLRAVVEPGVVNLHVSNVLAKDGLYYVPDPSSQKASTIGGNVGENSGGPHTLISGVIPAALEMMDALSIQAVEQATRAGYPTDAGAVLLVELEGMREGMDDLVAGITELCKRNNAREVRIAASQKERALLWAGRKNAFGAMGRISPDFYVMDGVIPRSRLPEVLRRIDEVSKRSGLRIANVFHAGDGNLHPLCLFDGDEPGQIELARQVGAEVLKICADVGGALTGEHGIGVEKRDLMPLVFSEADMDVMRRVKAAWDQHGLCNPGKVLPTPGACVDVAETRHGRSVL